MDGGWGQGAMGGHWRGTATQAVNDRAGRDGGRAGGREQSTDLFGGSSDDVLGQAVSISAGTRIPDGEHDMTRRGRRKYGARRHVRKEKRKERTRRGRRKYGALGQLLVGAAHVWSKKGLLLGTL